LTGASATEAQLAQIVDAVRIETMTRCAIGGRSIEVGPPLPNRFPPLPLVHRLQAELYTGAYCTRIGGGGFDQLSADAGEMVAALSAANASRPQRDPNWLVLERDQAGVVTVAKRGMVRRLGPGELGPDVPATGAVVSIPIMREVPDAGGFYFAYGETIESSPEGRPLLRFYWNVPVESAPALMAALTRRLNEGGIPFAFKLPRRAQDYHRFDAGVLFVATPRHDAVVARLPSIHAALADRLRPDVPLFTWRLAPGLGFAEDPGTDESFGMARCRLLAEALWTAFVRDVRDPPGILAEIGGHFLRNGLHLAAAHLRPWSVDRHRHAMLA